MRLTNMGQGQIQHSGVKIWPGGMAPAHAHSIKHQKRSEQRGREEPSVVKTNPNIWLLFTTPSSAIASCNVSGEVVVFRVHHLVRGSFVRRWENYICLHRSDYRSPPKYPLKGFLSLTITHSHAHAPSGDSPTIQWIIHWIHPSFHSVHSMYLLNCSLLTNTWNGQRSGRIRTCIGSGAEKHVTFGIYSS